MPYSQFVEFTLLAAQPVPVWTAAVDAKTHRYHPPITEDDLCESFDVLSWDTDFRGVGLDRLQTILATGVDVEPTTAPIFVSDFDKAWEYGGWPKVVMAFDGCTSSSRTVRSSSQTRLPTRSTDGWSTTPPESRISLVSAFG